MALPPAPRGAGRTDENRLCDLLRVAINQTTVEEYADDLREGASFPPVLLFNDGTQHWLADGIDRVLAAESIGLKEIAAEVRQGTQRDAVLYSCGAARDSRTAAD